MISVLVVDDEVGARTMLAMALRGTDIHVDAVADGASAFEFLRRRKYHWVVSDIRLPGIDGITLIKEISRINPGTHALLISAVANEDDVQALPIAGFWRKPFDPFVIRAFIIANQNLAPTTTPYALRQAAPADSG
jgi:two-component system nitrogen regulation response regulator GlnG